MTRFRIAPLLTALALITTGADADAERSHRIASENRPHCRRLDADFNLLC